MRTVITSVRKAIRTADKYPQVSLSLCFGFSARIALVMSTFGVPVAQTPSLSLVSYKATIALGISVFVHD